MGDKGDPGDPGADGQLRIYGDGSAGAVTVTVNNSQLFNQVAADGNLQFTDFTVDAGVTLLVPSGTAIRCTGTFTNNGVILVEIGAQGGFAMIAGGAAVAGLVPGLNAPNPGISRRPAGFGELGDSTATRNGGLGGTGINAGQARTILRPGIYGGGGGAGGTAEATAGEAGGGSLLVLAQTAIANAGTINANGGDNGAASGGGGGGGVVVLASPGAVTNTGTITANGGTGSAGNTRGAPGGGGGGGIVHLLAPAITAGTVTVAGATGGAAQGVGSISAATRSGGGAGGGAGGNGGSGGNALTTGASTQGVTGLVGHVFQTQVDPTALF